MNNKVVPTYSDLVSMTELKSKENDFQVLLNQDPPDAWVKTNTIAGNSRYIPIDKIEYLLTRLFVKWWVEILDYRIIANSVSVHVRLFYVSPITGETLHQDGIGAAPLQTDKDAGATDFNRIKSAAVQMALPSAKSYATKDAAENIGRLFGKDLNRKDLMAYEPLAGRFNVLTKEEVETKRMETLIKKAESKQVLNKLKPNVPNELQDLFTQKMAELV